MTSNIESDSKFIINPDTRVDKQLRYFPETIKRPETLEPRFINWGQQPMSPRRKKRLLKKAKKNYLAYQKDMKNVEQIKNG